MALEQGRGSPIEGNHKQRILAASPAARNFLIRSGSLQLTGSQLNDFQSAQEIYRKELPCKI
jgi:hypothetical protein